LYDEHLGKHNLVEWSVKATVYSGLLMIAPTPHLCVNVHDVSRGNLSVVTFTSTSVPEVHVVVGDVGLELGLTVLVKNVGCAECVASVVGWCVLVGANVGWAEYVAMEVGCPVIVG
jgi:hypothetical protein